MNFADFFTGSIDKIIEKTGEAIDRLVTSDEEKLQLRNELSRINLDASLKAQELALQFDQEITKRLQADMQSDSWLSKNIRPATLIFILVMYSLLSISSGFDFKVTQAYIELLGQWGMLIMSFYFGGRTIEKIASSIKSKGGANG